MATHMHTIISPCQSYKREASKDIYSHFKSNNPPYFPFYPKSQKPIKTVIQHLPFSTTEDI
jgi:hypothetical protein